MTEILKAHWFMISAVLSGFIWAIVRGEKIKTLETRVDHLEKAEGGVSLAVCLNTREACQKHLESELSHGRIAFEEIHTQLSRYEERSEERHQILMEHLIKVAGTR